MEIIKKPTAFPSFQQSFSLKPTCILAKIPKSSKNPQLFTNSDKIFLKTHTYSSKGTQGAPHAGGLLPIQASSVEEHLRHAHAQLRTHARTQQQQQQPLARTHERNESDFPVGLNPPTSDLDFWNIGNGRGDNYEIADFPSKL